MIKGLMTRDQKHLSGTKHDKLLDGGVVLLRWKDLEPHQGSFNWKPLREARQKYHAARVRRLRLRILGGINSPDWVKEEVGRHLWKDGNQTYSLPNMWTGEYAGMWGDLHLKVARKYGGEFEEVHVSGAGTVYGEPYIRQFSNDENVVLLQRWGVDLSEDAALHTDVLDFQAEAWKGKATRVMSCFPWQHMVGTKVIGNHDLKLEQTMKEVALFVENYPNLSLMANDLREHPGDRREALYAALQATGQRISFQTAAPARIGNWKVALQRGLALGAKGIELPVGYQEWDFDELGGFAWQFTQ